MSKRPGPTKLWEYAVFGGIVSFVVFLSVLALALISISDTGSYRQCLVSNDGILHAVYAAAGFFVFTAVSPLLIVLYPQHWMGGFERFPNSMWLWIGAAWYPLLQLMSLSIYADCGNVLQLVLSQVAAFLVVAGAALCARFWRWW